MNTNSQEPMIYTLAEAPWYIYLHLGVAVMSLLIGILVLLRQKGTNSHKFFGRCWVVLMLSAALSSFFIQARGHFSPIHILSVVILIIVPLGVMHIRRGNVRRHQYSMVGAFVGLAIAGAFTLLPYRMLGQLVFGQP